MSAKNYARKSVSKSGLTITQDESKIGNFVRRAAIRQKSKKKHFMHLISKLYFINFFLKKNIPSL
jgi:hypothetical protein